MLVSKALAAKVGVLVAAGGIALSGVAAASASTAAPAVHRIPTALSISNSKRVEHAHQTTAVINGHLTAGTYNLRHLPVVLQRLGIKGHWNRVQLKLDPYPRPRLLPCARLQEAGDLPPRLPRHEELRSVHQQDRHDRSGQVARMYHRRACLGISGPVLGTPAGVPPLQARW